MNGAIVRHRRTELATFGVLFLEDLEVFTIERRAGQLDEGVYTVELSDFGQRVMIGQGGMRLLGVDRMHGAPGTIGVGLAAMHHRLTESDTAWQLVRKRLMGAGNEAVTIEIIDQSEDGDTFHEDQL